MRSHTPYFHISRLPTHQKVPLWNVLKREAINVPGFFGVKNEGLQSELCHSEKYLLLDNLYP